MREQDRNLAAFGLDPFHQRFVFVHAYAIALPTLGAVASLWVFLTLYFLFLWFAWLLAVWMTAPKQAPQTLA